jgi:copper(I)-binding protein
MHRTLAGPKPRRPAARRWQAAICGAAVLGAPVVAGCAAPAQAGPVIQLSSAQVTPAGISGVTNVYVDVTNNGPTDELVGAKLSVGGRVTLRSPIHTGVVVMRTVGAIRIPARSFLGLDPNASHLLVTHTGTMKAGTEITLTLVFRHAGAISTPALVTDPESGGASYFLN